jgi:hypothetical protein
LLLVVVPFETAAQASATDETRIRAIVEEQVTAWNAGDAVAFSKGFAENGSFTIFTGFLKGSKLAMSITRIRFVRPDVAIVDLATELSNLSGAPPGVRPNAAGRILTRLQEVLVGDNGVWRVELYHNVDVKES